MKSSKPKIIHIDWAVVGLGIYIHTRPYRYVALQLGPAWIYLYHAAWFDRKRGYR